MLNVADITFDSVQDFVAVHGVELRVVGDSESIPGSFWGAPEAGLIGSALFVQAVTPVHSLLHELSHYLCMSDERRAELHTDAGGDDQEEEAVCYLQSVLADLLPGYGSDQLLRDMDSWGYSFRQGSARAWLAEDGEAARAWLIARGLID